MRLAYFAPLDSHGGLLVWLFGGGLGTNIGASLVWGFVAAFVGYLVAKRVKSAWAALHRRHDEHAASLALLHKKFDDLAPQKPQSPGATP